MLGVAEAKGGNTFYLREGFVAEKRYIWCKIELIGCLQVANYQKLVIYGSDECAVWLWLIGHYEYGWKQTEQEKGKKYGFLKGHTFPDTEKNPLG